MSHESYTIHNDVLLTDSGVAFLIGGNHSVLNYITEKTKPSSNSFNNFAKNISRRAHIAHLCKAKYLHVIFPDKQSILRSEFPINNTIRLGDKYLQHMGVNPLINFVLYPSATLQRNHKNEVYQKLDTHLTDHGSLLVLRDILQKLDEPAGEALDELEKLITLKKKNNGDLGAKFTPNLFQESIHLKSNWNYQYFSSNGSFNNGQIDIYLSPDAAISKKILIFGDSFYRLMLKQFSKIFKEVIFLRTPYLHNEMIELIIPDIILTGNSERYLAEVASDLDAPAFQLYAYTHNAVSKPSFIFINSFGAVTSPNAAASKIFIKNIFDDLSQPKIIAGPSHMVRWGQHLKNGLVDRPSSVADLVGFGGAPIWSKKLIDSVENLTSIDTKILLMVGDFRFGNEICLHSSRETLPLFSSGFSGISSNAITQENDVFMLEKCKKALDVWNGKFNNKIHFIFWDLFCRQVQDRLAGRHISNKKYLHPNWNLAPIQALVPADKLIDLTPLLTLPMHEAVRLFIDGSSHPSHIGYLFIINSFIYGSDTVTAYNKAVYDVEKMIFSTVDLMLERRSTPVTICGRSVWLDTLIRYLGSSGVDILAEKGLTLVPFNSQIGHINNNSIEKLTQANSELYFVSEHGLISDVPSAYEPTFRDMEWVPTPKNSFAWESSCASIISKRNEKPHSLFGQLNPESAQVPLLDLSDADVELGPYGYPTISGILKFLNQI